LREQDPAFFELPANLKPMPGMGNLSDLLNMGAAAPATEPTTPTTLHLQQVEMTIWLTGNRLVLMMP
jgi:hypothetical protein